MDSPHTLVQASPARAGAPPRERIARRADHAGGASSPEGERVLGRYRLLEQLGSGGFGVVWRAHDELLHREVALKRVWLGPDGDSERASREALATARLSHPAIVALHEACAHEGAFYLISELVDGETLARLIAADALEDEEILEIGVALASALSHAHERGVIHRDIKPQNVLVPDPPERQRAAQTLLVPAKLTDFGGASLVGEAALTRTGDVIGTLAYMAPEQSDGREVGAQADLYSLALVIYEALCGVNPVRAATPAATVRRIGSSLPPLGRERRDLPAALTQALDRALAPSPRDRGTLSELRRALEHGLKPQLQDAETPDRTRAPRRVQLPRVAWLAGAAALICWQASAGRWGVALLALAALLPLSVLPGELGSRRLGAAWLACALAPVLGLVSLAGAFPALAGQAAGWRQRAALAALGYWWLRLAEPLLGRNLWLAQPANTPAHGAWEGSLSLSAAHVLAPALTLGVLFGALLWGAGSMLLPWVVRGRSAAFDLVTVTVWSAALAAAAPVLDAGLSAHAAHPSPRGAALGAILGGMIALAARALRGPV